MRRRRNNTSSFNSTINFINQELCSFNLSEYIYLDNIDDYELELPQISWSYRTFGMLRDLIIKVKEGISLEPDDVFDHPEIKSELWKKYIDKGESHLICHCDYKGFFVPINFHSRKLPGTFLSTIGSSMNLRNELVEIAGSLDFTLGNYNPNHTLLYEQRENELESDPLGHEKFLVLRLYNMAVASIMYNLVIEII